jgi:hypothetical protein
MSASDWLSYPVVPVRVPVPQSLDIDLLATASPVGGSGDCYQCDGELALVSESVA